ncbi:MAG: hypothetical protein ACJA08_001832 [Cyclobacteriaceae bacterium]
MDIETIKIDLIHWLTEVKDLSILEKLQSIRNQETNELSDSHKKLLDERIAHFEENPHIGLDWETVIREIEESA